MEPQEVKPEGRRPIGQASARREDICTACLFDAVIAGSGSEMSSKLIGKFIRVHLTIRMMIKEAFPCCVACMSRRPA